MPASTKRSVSRRIVSPARMAALRSSSRRVFNPDATAALLALAPLGFLALAAGGGTLVELAAAGLREDPCLLDLLVESAQRGLEGLALADDHLRQLPGITRPFRSQDTSADDAADPRIIAAATPFAPGKDTHLYQAQPGGQLNFRP